MNGKDTPVFGIKLVTTAILRTTCIEICASTPTTTIEPNKSDALLAIYLILLIKKINNAIIHNAPKIPSSSHTMEKIISLEASGTYPNF